MTYPGPLFGPAMHEYVMRELELGKRVAAAEDDEACGFGPLFDALVNEHQSRLWGGD